MADIILEKLNLVNGDILTLEHIEKIDSNTDITQNKINETSNKIGDLTGLTTTDKDSIVDAINENTASLSEKANQDDLDATNIIVTSHTSQISAKANDSDNSRTTTSKSVTGAINELNAFLNLLSSTKANQSIADNLQTQINNLVLNASGTDVTEVVQARDIFATLTSRLNMFQTLFKEVAIPAIVSGGYYNTSNALVYDAGYRYTDYIDLQGATTLIYKLYGQSVVNSIILYDKDKNVLESITQGSATTPAIITGVKYLADNVKYMKVSLYNPQTSGYELQGIYKTNIASSRLLTYLESLWQVDIDNSISNAIDDTEVYNVGNSTIPNGFTQGYLNANGYGITTDTNWFTSPAITTLGLGEIKYSLVGHTAIGSVVLFNRNGTVLNVIKGTVNQAFISGTITDLSETAYFRFTIGAVALGVGNVANQYLNYIVNKFDKIEKEGKIKRDLIAPYSIYTVANDIGGKKGHNRNYSASVYLDHSLFISDTDEKDIHFKDGEDKFSVFSPIYVSDANEENPTVVYNDGNNILEKTVSKTVTGSDIEDTTVSTKHRSVLNSPTINVTPRVLVIGDSRTYAELATMPDDDFSTNYAYHLMCKEFFMKDKIDNGNSGSECLFLGTMKKSRTMNYKGTDYSITTHHEGRRGYSLQQYLDGSVLEFWDSVNSKFSINTWLSKYKTLDDSGNRLTLGTGTGTQITVDNLNTIDVCTPTHILIMLGANGTTTIDQYKSIVQLIKAEYPNMVIALTEADSAGTYFPSKHPNCSEDLAFWNDTNALTHSQGSRHQLLRNIMIALQNEFCNSTYEDDDVYVLPFYYVQPTAESASLRVIDTPDSQFELTNNNKFMTKYGWHPTTHINGAGHINWGYQLYSWLKYTIAKGL